MPNKHYIGTTLQTRMKKLGLTTQDISHEIWQPPAYIQIILDNKIAYEDIDEFDINLLCAVLHCEPELFTDPDYHDMISDMPDMPSHIMSKIADVQSYINTFAFLMNAEHDRTYRKKV